MMMTPNFKFIIFAHNSNLQILRGIVFYCVNGRTTDLKNVCILPQNTQSKLERNLKLLLV